MGSDKGQESGIHAQHGNIGVHPHDLQHSRNHDPHHLIALGQTQRHEAGFGGHDAPHTAHLHTSLLENWQQHNKHVQEQKFNFAFSHDIQIHHDSPYQHSGEAMHNRTNLEEVARRKLTIPQMNSFEHDMAEFEKRATSNNLPSEKVAGFYAETARVLSEKAMHYNQTQRTDLALQLVHHAAHPEEVTQGQNGTCNVSSVEYRMFAKDPQAVAKMTAEICKDGTFVTADGTKLTDNWHSIKPTAGDTQRDILDRMVQTTLVNCHYERIAAQDFDGNKIGYRYEYTKDAGAFRVMVSEPNGSRHVQDDDVKGLPISDPEIKTDELRDIYNQATGKKDAAFVAGNVNPSRTEHTTGFESDEKVVRVGSASDLHKALIEGQRTHNFPMVLEVHTANNPFYTQQHRERPDLEKNDKNFGWHVVSISSYNEKTHTVKMHNSWGKSLDVNVGLDELYQATMTPKGLKHLDPAWN